MATIALSTIGQAFGGPAGALLGAELGRSIDGALARPRLSDLAIQSSAYGEPMPLLFGRMRLAGNLVWTLRSPWRGKGDAPAVASFAVALARGPVDGVGRIWADGALLRDAAGNWQARSIMRLHRGARGQGPDPLIAAAEGTDAPAYRSVAYAVFEDLDLSPFGGRIPNLSFEVTGVGLGEGCGRWAARLAAAHGVVLSADAGAAVEGYAAAGALTDDLAALAALGGLVAADDGAGLRLRAADGVAAMLDSARLAGGDAEGGARRARGRAPAAMEVAHLDPAREGQRGLQRAGGAGPARRLAFAAAMDADAAAAMAGRLLAEARAEAAPLTLAVGWRARARPGDVVRFEERDWRVERREFADWQAELRLTPLPEAAAASAADGGRGAPAALMPAPPTGVMLLTLPEAADVLMADGWAHAGPWLAAGGGPGWRGAALATLSSDIRRGHGRAMRRGIWGRLDAPLPADGVALTLVLDDAEDAPESRTAEAVAAGANRLWVGGEAMSFQGAEPLGEGRMRLTELKRALHGTTAAAHPAGVRAARLEEAFLVAARLPTAALSGPITLIADGPGDPPGGTTAAWPD